MSLASRNLIAIVIVAALALAGCGSSEPAKAMRAVDVTVDQPANPKLAAVRMVIENRTGRDDTLTSVSSEVADTVEIHRSDTAANGMTTMTAVASIPVPDGADVTFAPGGLHVMLQDLRRTLKAGDTFDLTLHFAHAGTVTVPVTVTTPGGTEMEHDHG